MRDVTVDQFLTAAAIVYSVFVFALGYTIGNLQRPSRTR